MSLDWTSCHWIVRHSIGSYTSCHWIGLHFIGSYVILLDYILHFIRSDFMSLQHIILSKNHIDVLLNLNSCHWIVDHSIELSASCHWIELHVIGSETSFDRASGPLKKLDTHPSGLSVLGGSTVLLRSPGISMIFTTCAPLSLWNSISRNNNYFNLLGTVIKFSRSYPWF